MARGPLPALPPGSREQRPSVCFGAVWTMALEFYPRRAEGPLGPNRTPLLQKWFLFLRRGLRLLKGGGVKPCRIARQALTLTLSPFGVGQVAAGRSPQGATASPSHHLLSTCYLRLIICVTLIVSQALSDMQVIKPFPPNCLREVLFQPREVPAPAGDHTAVAGRADIRLCVASLCQALEAQAHPAPVLET